MEKGPEMLGEPNQVQGAPKFQAFTVRAWTIIEVSAWCMAFVGLMMPYFYGEMPPSGGWLLMVFVWGVILGVVWVIAFVGYLIVTLVDLRAKKAIWLGARLLVVVLSLLILRSARNGWPEKLALRASIEALDRTADRIEAGDMAAVPAWCGVYRIASGEVEGEVVVLKMDWPGGGRVVWARRKGASASGLQLADVFTELRSVKGQGTTSYSFWTRLSGTPNQWGRFYQPDK